MSWRPGAVGEVVRLHLVAHDLSQAAGAGLGDLRLAAGADLGGLGARVGVEEGEALDALGRPGDDLHRDDAAHGEAEQREARRRVAQDLCGEASIVSCAVIVARWSVRRPTGRCTAARRGGRRTSCRG
jgi:hypothetical protein